MALDLKNFNLEFFPMLSARTTIYTFYAGLLSEIRFATTTLTNGGLSVGDIYDIKFSTRVKVLLQTLTNSPSLQYALMDDKGNYLTPFRSNTTYQALYTTSPNQTYVFRFRPTSLIPPTNNYFAIIGFVTPTIDDYFPGGFLIDSNLPAGISVNKDSFGNLTINFNNYLINANSNIYIATTEPCISTGTLNITPTDNTAFKSVNIPLAIDGSYYIKLDPLRTGVVNTSVLVSISGVGVSTQINLASIPSNFISEFSLSKKRQPVTLVEPSKEIINEFLTLAEQTLLNE